MAGDTQQWDANYERLKAFYKKHGHCRVPRRGDYLMLAKWTTRQRQRKQLLDDQRAKLTAIGYEWTTRPRAKNDQWQNHLNRLKAFQKKYGHTNVPGNDPKLGVWVANQRRYFHGGKLRQDRKEMLDAVGFQWTSTNWKGTRTLSATADETGRRPKRKSQKSKKGSTAHDKAWHAMFQRLNKYRLEHGDCAVPYSHEDHKLALWVTTQRRCYNNKTWLDDQQMQKDRIALLESIGFAWSLPKGSNQKKTAASSGREDTSGANEEGPGIVIL